MIKKHLIACSGLLVVMLLAKLLIYSAPVHDLKSFSQKVNIPFQEEKTETPQKSKIHHLTFSNETLPKGRTIAWKMKKYLTAHSYKKIQTNKLDKKAAIWFPVIVPILSAYGIPEDFKYMPLVESGMKAGISPKGAAGFWQFMPQTARDFGLRVDGDIDDRNNMRKSTIAAAKYIKSLYREFDSWTLAAAAYNIGEGSLKRQINRQNQDNYFKMKLNRETASYVYKLISMKEIIENPTRYGYSNKASRLLAKADIRKQPAFPYPVVEKNSLINNEMLVN